MLVLSVKQGEAVLVGECTIRVLATKEGKVQLGFEAPKEVKILREGLVTRENKHEG